MAGNVAKMTPKGNQPGAKIGLRGQLFGFWANCVFVQRYCGFAIYLRGSWVPGTIQNAEKARSLHRALEKVLKIGQGPHFVPKRAESGAQELLLSRVPGSPGRSKTRKKRAPLKMKPQRLQNEAQGV